MFFFRSKVLYVKGKMAMDVADNAKEAEIFCIQWNQHQSTIITGLKSLLQRDRFIDVQLECEGNFINAHRLVLSSCSPYFEVYIIFLTPL